MGENTRQRMIPWLVAQINGGKFPGLHWVDRSSETFRVPWKHGGKHDWSEKDSLIFKEWAVHTGRHREGIDEADWPCWKTRFRCAMNKLPDIEEVKTLSRLDGLDPYRVYKFLPRPVPSAGASRHSHTTACDTKPKVEYRDMTEDSVHQRTSQIPTTVVGDSAHTGSQIQNTNDDPEAMRISSLASDLNDIDPQDLLTVNSSEGQILIKQEEEEMDIRDSSLNSDGVEVDENLFLTDPHTGAPQRHIQSPYSQLKSAELMETHNVLPHSTTDSRNLSFQDHEIILSCRYREKDVGKYHIRNPSGCRLFHGPTLDIELPLVKEIYGNPDAEQIHFPFASELFDNKQQENLTAGLLEAMDRGLILTVENGNIYATRKCRCVVFVAPPHQNGAIVKLQRDEKVLIFDYQHDFKSKFYSYIMSQGPQPAGEVLISFGQRWRELPPNVLPYSNLLISANVCHPKAAQLLQKASVRTSPTQVSDSDEIDRFLKQVKIVNQDLEPAANMMSMQG